MPIHCVRQASTCAFLLIALFCGGCGHSDGRPVGGMAKFDGKPIAEGSITFEPADGNGPSGGGSIQGGVSGVPGHARERRSSASWRVRKTGRKVRPPMSGPPGPSGGATIDEVESYIPEIYNAKSSLTCEVVRDGQNRIDFDLKSP